MKDAASKKYKSFIFDLDGTLVDTAPDIAYYANGVLSEFGFPEKPLEAVKRAIGRGVHELLKDLGFEGDGHQLESAVELFKKRYGEAPVASTRPYPGVVEALSGPLSRVRKAIVTNKPHELTLRVLRELSLDCFFLPVIGEGKGFPRKPDPSAVVHVLIEHASSPAEALFVGDSRIDQDTARAAGVDFLWMGYGYDDGVAGNAGGLVKKSSDASEWAAFAGGNVK